MPTAPSATAASLSHHHHRHRPRPSQPQRTNKPDECLSGFGEFWRALYSGRDAVFAEQFDERWVLRETGEPQRSGRDEAAVCGRARAGEVRPRWLGLALAAGGLLCSARGRRRS